MISLILGEGVRERVGHFLLIINDYLFIYFFSHTGKPNESRVQFPENSQRQKQSGDCVFVVYSCRLSFYTYTGVRQSKLTSLNNCKLAFVSDLKISL